VAELLVRGTAAGVEVPRFGSESRTTWQCCKAQLAGYGADVGQTRVPDSWRSQKGDARAAARARGVESLFGMQNPLPPSRLSEGPEMRTTVSDDLFCRLEKSTAARDKIFAVQRLIVPGNSWLSLHQKSNSVLEVNYEVLEAGEKPSLPWRNPRLSCLRVCSRPEQGTFFLVELSGDEFENGFSRTSTRKLAKVAESLPWPSEGLLIFLCL
jgi:hypothetical protein